MKRSGGRSLVKNKLPIKLHQYLKQPYARILIPNEDGTYTAEMLEFPGCITQGENPQEAISNLEVAAKGWIQANIEEGRDIPSPCNDYNHSGKVLLRLSKSLHQQAASMSAREGCSLNQFIVTSVAARVGISDLANRIAEKLTHRTFHVINANIFLNMTASTDESQSPIILEKVGQNLFAPNSRDLVTHQENTGLTPTPS